MIIKNPRIVEIKADGELGVDSRAVEDARTDAVEVVLDVVVTEVVVAAAGDVDAVVADLFYAWKTSVVFFRSLLLFKEKNSWDPLATKRCVS